MRLEGGCHCSTVRYEVEGEAENSTLCHCSDCRRAIGAPMVAWAAFKDENFRVIQGEAKTRNSSGSAMRSFCPECGTSLWYRNSELMPGLVDIATATLDDPEAIPPEAHIQLAERIEWTAEAHRLPGFQRFPEAGDV